LISKISNYAPTFFNVQFAQPKQIVKNLQRFALPIIASVGLMYAATQANAGPVAYAACVGECLALTLGGFAPACLAACSPFLAAPTP